MTERPGSPPMLSLDDFCCDSAVAVDGDLSFGDASGKDLGLGPELVGNCLLKHATQSVDPMKQANRLSILHDIVNLHKNNDASAEAVAYGLMVDSLMHSMFCSFTREYADRLDDIKKITKESSQDMRRSWYTVVRRFVCTPTHNLAPAPMDDIKRAAGVKMMLCEHLRNTRNAQCFAVHTLGDNAVHCIAAHRSAREAWETGDWLSTPVASDVKAFAARVESCLTKNSSTLMLWELMGAFEPVMERVYRDAAAQTALPLRPEWTSCRVFCGPGLAALNTVPKSPQKLGSMRQHRKRKHSEFASDPFDGSEFNRRVEEYEIGRMYDIRVRGADCVLRHSTLKSLSRMGAEFINIYSLGHTLNHLRREVTNLMSAPRPGSFFEFVMPHMASSRQEHFTRGDGMFSGFDVSKRLKTVTQHYESLLREGGASGIEVLRGFSPTKCEKKGGSLATFVNHITSVMVCVGIDDYGEQMGQFKIGDPYSMVVVVVDLVRASYGSSKSHNQFPGLGLACVRHRKAHIVPCDSSMRSVLQGIMARVDKENSSMQSPEELLDHALVHSELITSGGLLCNLNNLMAGLRNTLSAMVNEPDVGLQVESHVKDHGALEMFMSADEMDESCVKLCFLHFAESHGSPATTCARHTALKTIMQLMMTNAQLDSIDGRDIASLAPNQCMFDAGMIQTAERYFTKLYKNLFPTPTSTHACHHETP